MTTKELKEKFGVKTPHGNKKFRCPITGQMRRWGETRKGIQESCKRLLKAFGKDAKPTDLI